MIRLKNRPIGMDKNFEAQCDARVLADAKAIQADPKRLKAAAVAAKNMVTEKQKELTAMKGIARKAK